MQGRGIAGTLLEPILDLFGLEPGDALQIAVLALFKLPALQDDKADADEGCHQQEGEGKQGETAEQSGTGCAVAGTATPARRGI